MTQLIRYSVQELADMYGCTLEEVAEWYGADAIRVYYVREESALIGVQFEDGTIAEKAVKVYLENEGGYPCLYMK